MLCILVDVSIQQIVADPVGSNVRPIVVLVIVRQQSGIASGIVQSSALSVEDIAQGGPWHGNVWDDICIDCEGSAQTQSGGKEDYLVEPMLSVHP